MKSTSENSVVKGKAWLRDASMRRLSLFVKNKTELIGNAAQLGLGVMYPDNLEKSGLTSTEIFHLEQWVSGKIRYTLPMKCLQIIVSFL